MASTLMGMCNICNTSLNFGAVFKAECSHVFHFHCISYNLQNGSHTCPICFATWTQVQFPKPSPPPWAPAPSSPFINSRGNGSLWGPQNPFARPSPTIVDPSFNDDEPLPSSSHTTQPKPQQDSGLMTVKALPEYSALCTSDQSDSFAVLVGIRAPPLPSDMADARAPLDLVAVLDVSGSMYGPKIELLKQAMKFVIRNLGPTDRLSIVTFSTSSQRLIPLKRMTEEGQADTIRVVDSILASGSTNIIAGLQTAVKVLDQRRQRNLVTSIILLSDGQDTDNRNFMSCLNGLPQSIRSNAVASGERLAPNAVVPVYTFGFGDDHDANALHTISDGSGGTFSFIGAIEVIQDAFARCLGGLLSVVAQEVEIQVHSGSPEVRIKSIPSGRYKNTIDSFGGQHGVVYIGDVYADEEKQFLVYLSIPQEDASSTTKVLEMKCSHKDPLSNKLIVSNVVTAEIRRPIREELSEEDKKICLEVDREKNRISVAEGIALAQEMAERGELERARSILEEKRSNITKFSCAGIARDAPTISLCNQVQMVEECMASKVSYNAGGRAFAYAAQSSHQNQRATTLAAPQCGQYSCTSFGGTSNYGFGAAPTSFAFCPTSAGLGAPSSGFGAPLSTGFGASSNTGFGGFETSFQQQMVKKSQIERQPNGENQVFNGFGPANP